MPELLGPSSLPVAGAGGVAPLLGPYLGRQSWAQAALGTLGVAGVPVRLVSSDVLREGRPGLASIVVDAGEAFDRRLHVLVGWRGLQEVGGTLLRPDAVIGTGEDSEGEVLVYDALADRELCLALLGAVTEGREEATRVRLVQSLVSHASLVFDERLFMKCYRVIERRHRPEIETLMRLDEVGFNRVFAPVAHWARGDDDLGLVREFVPSALEGKALALTSLRDLLARAGSGAEGPAFEQIGLAGGDLGDEMRRLGETTAQLHVALADAFGALPAPDAGTGMIIRVHGDYHLRRVMRVDAGWLVAGFGDDPLTGPDAGTGSQGEPRLGSPLEDVANLWASLREVASEAAALQPASTRAHAEALATGWVRHNRRALLRGYLAWSDVSRLLPGGGPLAVERWLEERTAELAAATAGPFLPGSEPEPGPGSAQ